MIINLKKYFFLGTKSHLAEFFAQAQELGFIEFIRPRFKRSAEIPKEIKCLSDAIKILRKQPVKTPYLGSGDLGYAHEVATHVVSLKAEMEKLFEEQRFLEAEISRIAPFGDFSFEDISYIEQKTKLKLQFFCMKSSKAETMQLSPDLIYMGTDYDLDYFIAMNRQPKSYPAMIEMHFDRSLSELKNYLAFVSEGLHQIHAELKGFAGHLAFLRDALIQHLDHYFLTSTKKEVTPLEGEIFSIEGWVPENKIAFLGPLTKDLLIHFEPIRIEEDDRIPTCMQNQKNGLLGEELVKIYDIPAYNDKDPSLWVLWSFALFFAMIVADAGYGLLYLAAALYAKWKLKELKASSKRMLKLSMILASSCVIWGLLTTSFFGIRVEPGHFLGKISLIRYLADEKASYHLAEKDDVYAEWVDKMPQLKQADNGTEFLNMAYVEKDGHRDYEMLGEFSSNILLEFSLFVGLIHICISLLRYARQQLWNVGWVLFSIGGYLYFPVVINATSLMHFAFHLPKELGATIGLQLIYAGMVFAVLVSLILRKLKGIVEITVVVQVFGDILSYLRLYALALASTIMADTFNDLGRQVGLVFGGIIILAGHGVNVLLGTMAGVIHGLRLNFIEWYHYCFKGGGKLFNPLRKLKSTE